MRIDFCHPHSNYNSWLGMHLFLLNLAIINWDYILHFNSGLCIMPFKSPYIIESCKIKNKGLQTKVVIYHIYIIRSFVYSNDFQIKFHFTNLLIPFMYTYPNWIEINIHAKLIKNKYIGVQKLRQKWCSFQKPYFKFYSPTNQSIYIFFFFKGVD